MTATKSTDPAERLGERFVAYLFEEFQGTKHVRRVATWIGFLLKAIQHIAGDTIRLHQTRQITFEYRKRKFKARYNHKLGGRGGIEIVEILPGRGSPDGEVLLEVTNLAEAEKAYHTMKRTLDAFIKR